MLRTIEDKLQRHESREQMHAELVKKALTAIDKKVKSIEPMKGTISRLDQRLATVESILMQNDERERIQLQKTIETVEDIQKNLPAIIEKMKQDILGKVIQSGARIGILYLY